MEMKRLAFAVEGLEVKEDGDSRTIEGFASVFNNIDSYSDIVMPGAFAKSIKSRKPVMLWQHNSDHYPVTFWSYLFDESGQATGKVKVRLALQMVDANHYTGHGIVKAYDLAGQPMVSPFDGPVTVNGTRVEVELL